MSRTACGILLLACIAGCSARNDRSPAHPATTRSAHAALNNAILGLYLTPSKLCTSPESGESCSKSFDDCIRIAKDGERFMVQLHSVQANQHTCTFVAQMIGRDSSIVFESEHGNVMIMVENGDIKVISDSDPTALGLGFCGAHADIDGLTFPKNSKLDADSSGRCPF